MLAVQARECGTDNETIRGDRDSGIKDAKVCDERDKNGKYEEWVHQRDSVCRGVDRSGPASVTEAMLRCFGHTCKCREAIRDLSRKGWWRWSCQSRRRTERLMRRYLDTVKEDMRMVTNRKTHTIWSYLQWCFILIEKNDLLELRMVDVSSHSLQIFRVAKS